jgi:hypothetical protein
MNRYLLCGLAICASVLTGCSSFDDHWKAAAEKKGHASRWDGRWASATHKESNGGPHGGRLRCVLEPQADRSLVAHFHANWKIFSGNYDVTLHPVPGGPGGRPTHEYRGTHQMPKIFGGLYHYDALIRGDHFTAQYSSSYDHGSFVLHRLPPVLEHFQLHTEH